MRDEITEPKHWRTRPTTAHSSSAHRRADVIPLRAEAVDAVFDSEPLTYAELVQQIHEQLAVLETQRRELQKLLAQCNS